MKRRKNPLVQFLICVFAVPTCAVLVENVSLTNDWTILRPWLLVGGLLGVAHLLLRPILSLLSAPIGCITLGLSGFAIDIALIYGCAYFVEGFAMPSLLYAVLTACLINAVCAITGNR